jgi:aspartate ammonia-lyase
MPGKINPVIPMSVCQVGFAVTGYDVVVATACQQGQLEINAYEPVIASHLLPSIRLLTGAVAALTNHCISGIEANVPGMLEHLVNSSALATVLVPRLGYDAVSRLVRQAERDGTTFLEALTAQGLLSREEALVLLERAASGST